MSTHRLVRSPATAILAPGPHPAGGSPGTLLFQWNGPLELGRAIAFTARRDISFGELCARLGVVASTQTTFAVYLNGTSVASLVVPAASEFVAMPVAIAMVRGDTLSVGCTEVGSGATTALVQLEEAA